jgi:peptide/nickel transport system ATP-binding protein
LSELLPQSIAAGCTLLKIKDLVRHFDVSPPFLNRLIDRTDRRIVKAVDGVSFEIAKGETFSLVGESGCGKSTVARLVVGLYAPSKGEINFAGVALGRLAHREKVPEVQAKMQMIFQDPYASLNPRWRVSDIIAEPIHVRGLLKNKKGMSAQVIALLLQVGLSAEDAERFPHEFSGGQRQRISIARALAGEPEFLVCDEPTSALDVSVQAQILNLMKDLQNRLGLTYLFISHDLAVVYHVSTKVGVMYLGRICEWAETKTLFTRPSHPYTRMLLDAIPDLAMTGRARIPVAGEVPSPINPPPGCSFHPRCPFAEQRCKTERPELIESDGIYVACHAVEEGRLPPYEQDAGKFATQLSAN